MNRTDRLLAIVLELQRHRRSACRADDLASLFEVSKRTIYRDIQALCVAGVPIAVAGRQGYSLAEGYFLPPVRFTTDEALILALGSEFMANTFDDDYRVAAQNAYRKIDAILPQTLQHQVEQLKRGLQFSAKRLGDDQRGLLRRIRLAVAERRRIRLHYTILGAIEPRMHPCKPFARSTPTSSPGSPTTGTSPAIASCGTRFACFA